MVGEPWMSESEEGDIAGWLCDGEYIHVKYPGVERRIILHSTEYPFYSALLFVISSLVELFCKHGML